MLLEWFFASTQAAQNRYPQINSKIAR